MNYKDDFQSIEKEGLVKFKFEDTLEKGIPSNDVQAFIYYFNSIYCLQYNIDKGINDTGYGKLVYKKRNNLRIPELIIYGKASISFIGEVEVLKYILKNLGLIKIDININVDCSLNINIKNIHEAWCKLKEEFTKMKSDNKVSNNEELTDTEFEEPKESGLADFDI